MEEETKTLGTFPFVVTFKLNGKNKFWKVETTDRDSAENLFWDGLQFADKNDIYTDVKVLTQEEFDESEAD